MIDAKIIEQFTQRLTQEKSILEIELTDIGKVDTLNPNNWHGTAGSFETEDATGNDRVLADRFEETTTNESITSELEERLKNINDALARITNGSYGICIEGEGDIPLERLEANPAAATCIVHGK